jgi:hypothetical protein
VLSLNTWTFPWLYQYKVGGPNSFTSKTVKSLTNEYDLAPFDASQELKKLSSWDSPPSDVEMEEIVPLLTRIQVLKGGRGGAPHTTLSSTPATPSFQAMDLFWFGRFFSSM